MSTFVARRRNLETDVATLKESINALNERIDASKVQIANAEKQAALYDEEIDSKAQLASSGLIRKSEVLALQRGHAASTGEVAHLLGEMGDARERMRTANATLERIGITAPVHGIVVKMRYHTPDGAIEPMGSIMDWRSCPSTIRCWSKRVSARRTSTMCRSARRRACASLA
jgi:multidrug resistance efflux pump